MAKPRGNILVDLDRTIAEYISFHPVGVIGEPIPRLTNKLKIWISKGWDVRLFTARYADPQWSQYGQPAWEQWSKKVFGKEGLQDDCHY